MRTAVRALLALAVLCGPIRAAEPPTVPPIMAVDAIGMTVADMDASLDFYSRVLGFTPVRDIEVSGDAYERLRDVFPVRMRVVRLALGDEQLELTEYVTPRGRPAPADARSNDRWFQHVAIVVRDMDRAFEWLRDHRVAQVSPEPQRLPDWNPNAGGIRAFYFRDPDGHPLELIWFPPGKGDPRWHDPADRLFLGIDHTAVVVSDTDSSLRFYRDALGLRVTGDSTNYGPEQERLNNVFGARLHITGLRAAAGPGVEFLEYLSPRNGRAAVGIQSNDIAHWETTVASADAADAFSQLQRARVFFVSPSVAMLGSDTRFAKGILVQDPDGHAVKVVQQ